MNLQAMSRVEATSCAASCSGDQKADTPTLVCKTPSSPIEKLRKVKKVLRVGSRTREGLLPTDFRAVAMCSSVFFAVTRPDLPFSSVGCAA